MSVTITVPTTNTHQQFKDVCGVADTGYDLYLLAIAKLLNDNYLRLWSFYFHALIQQRHVCIQIEQMLKEWQQLPEEEKERRVIKFRPKKAYLEIEQILKEWQQLPEEEKKRRVIELKPEENFN